MARKVVDGSGEERIELKSPFEWRRHFDGTAQNPWTSIDEIPHFGSIVSVVIPRELQTSSRKTEARGIPAIMMGIYEHKGGVPDRSIIVAPLEKLLNTGRVTFMRTKDFRKPKIVAFPMKELRDQLKAVRSAPRVNQLLADEYAERLWHIGEGG